MWLFSSPGFCHEQLVRPRSWPRSWGWTVGKCSSSLCSVSHTSICGSRSWRCPARLPVGWFQEGFLFGGGSNVGNSPWEDQQRDCETCQRVKENSMGCGFLLRRTVYCGPYHKLTPAHTWGTIRGARDSNWGQLLGRQVPYFLWYSPSSLSSRAHCFWRKKKSCRPRWVL